MKRSKQACHSGKWKVSGFADLMFFTPVEKLKSRLTVIDDT